MSHEEDLYSKRDQIIGEMHSDLKHMVRWTSDHDIKDDARFNKMDNKLELVDKLLYGGIGIIVFVQFVLTVIK